MIYDLENITYNGYIIPMELWKPVTQEMVPGVCPIYWISNIGNLYMTDINRFSNATVKENSYIRVLLKMQDGTHKMTTIHRLVCMAFNGMPPDLSYEVDHINCDKSCSVWCNLEWVTKYENNNRARNNKLFPIAEDHYKAILTNSEVEEICTMLQKRIPINDICSIMEAKIYPRIYSNGLHSIIYQILNKEVWKEISSKYDFPSYSRIHLSEEEIEIACNMMQDGIDYDTIMDTIGITEPHERERVKETLYNIKRGRSFKEISCKYDLKVTQTEKLTKDESELVAKNVADGVPFRNTVEMISRASTDAKVKEAIYSIYRGKTKKDRVAYYKSLK